MNTKKHYYEGDKALAQAAQQDHDVLFLEIFKSFLDIVLSNVL